MGIYSWDQVSGPAVSLLNATTDKPTFTTPNVESNGVSLTFNLTATDTGGLKNTDSCIVNITWLNDPPKADFSYDEKKKLIMFNDSSDSERTIVSWFWDFGDGETSTEQNPEHRYTKFGVYSVTLTVTDNDEASQSTSQDINVSH
ncbi:MAG TPA: PKD domain-containing protein [Desulfobacterales bacterium]|nr:PKD domain-containing protein [Desulfobacterales bacterium]